MSAVTQVEVYQDDAGEWRWRAKAGNGEVVADGEGYTRKADARQRAEDLFPGVPVLEIEGD